MRVRDLLYETGSALDSNRIRSALTILGIVIGISSVITMTSMIGGIRESIMGSMGLNAARTVTFFIEDGYYPSLDQIEALEELMPMYEFIMPSQYGSAQVSSDTASKTISIEGVGPEYVTYNEPKFDQGRFFTTGEDKRGSLVAVMDTASVRAIFGKEDAKVVGKTININGVPYTVVGVLNAQLYEGSTGSIYLPYTACSMRITGTSKPMNIRGLAKKDANMDTIAETTKATLIKYLNLSEEAAEYLDVYTAKTYIDQSNNVMAQFQTIMTVVASISLLVGGIGIMNMMLTNVTERIREIGLRKALGARRSDITMQFLLESICLCIAGGIIGIIIGYLGSFGIMAAAGSSLSSALDSTMNLKPAVDVKAVLFAAGVCVLIGTLFGYYPARRAASLDPVEALHYQ